MTKHTTKKQSCKLCNQSIVSGGLCREHHVEAKYEEWLDNTDPENLGIVKWIEELLPEFASNATPQMHKELYLDLLKLYNPDYVNKYERLYEFICFREGAKSTAANTLFISYILANNGKSIRITIDGEVRSFKIQEDTIIIISQTAGSAEEFTVRIRDAFSTNERLRYYYSLEISNAIDTVSNQWTRSAFKINNAFVQGVGSGQQIRGKVKGASRPTLVIADDIYSEKSVLTEESRDKTKSWWNNAVMNSIDNLKGKVVMLGTILHDDTILVQLEHNPQWQTKKIALMDIELFHEFVEKYLVVDRDASTCTLPFSDIKNRDERMHKQKVFFNEVQKEKDWKLSWPERINLYFIAIKYQEAVYNQSVSGMYQEYFHITKSPHDIIFRKDFFLRIGGYEVKKENGHTWLKLDSENQWQIVEVHFGIDLAGTGHDDAVITVIATTAQGKIYVLHQAIGKWALRDDAKNDTGQDTRFKKIILDRSILNQVGIIDECFRLAKRFHPWRIKVGIASEEEQVVILMRQVFRENYDYTYIVGREQTKREGNKVERIVNTLAPYYQTRMVYHSRNLQKLEYQLEYLGSSDHDDCADSLECAFFGLTFPQNLAYTPEAEVQNMSRETYISNDWWVTA
jgi:hypothetical protein